MSSAGSNESVGGFEAVVTSDLELEGSQKFFILTTQAINLRNFGNKADKLDSIIDGILHVFIQLSCETRR